ncbi:MAG: di-heme oxidoredictase family protein [Balneolaceae bacterium]|jgi:CxxC motif-containing protein (DUF1111 family)
MNFKKSFFLIALASTAVLFHGCDTLSSDNNSEPTFTEQEINSGGAATVHEKDNTAFSRPAPNLSETSLEIHNAGDANFEASFVTAPAQVNGGLGPLFNNSSCTSCHVNDGRGKPFFDNGRISSVLVRVSQNGDEPGNPIPSPGFGLQLQNKSVFGKKPEADIEVIYNYIKEELADGTNIELRKPAYNIVNPYIPLPNGLHTSVRTAPPVFGMGLLQNIPEQQILANADPNDDDKDGISGKANYVRNDSTGQMELGRFGWKANQPTIIQQVASAYNQDMGVTSPYYSAENIYQNSQAADSLDDDPEISQEILEETAFYVKTLGVPAKRHVNDPEVKQGRTLFMDAGCQSCHIPSYTTGTDDEIPALSNQTIFPYTDLLVHDMGEELADHRSDFGASGTEWRTPPLWGIGLVEIVNGHQSFLHDGRARSVMEAIMWHGGEAEQSRQYVEQLSKSDRDALVAFIKAI